MAKYYVVWHGDAITKQATYGQGPKLRSRAQMGHHSVYSAVVPLRVIQGGTDECHATRGHTVPLLHAHVATHLLHETEKENYGYGARQHYRSWSLQVTRPCY